MNHSILVTGAGGFVGSAIVRTLVLRIRRGIPIHLAGQSRLQRVIALLKPGGDPWRLATVGDCDRLAIEHVNVLDPDDVWRVMRVHRPSVVVHSAIDPKVYGSLDIDERDMLQGAPVRSLMAAMAEYDSRRIICAGSALALRAGPDLREDSPRKPSSAYGHNKAWEEDLITRLGRELGVDWAILRLFYMFGQYEASTRLLPYLVSRHFQGRMASLGPGDRIRDFSDVHDIAEAFVAAASADSLPSHPVFNIGSGIGLSIKRFAEAVSNVTGRGDLVEFTNRIDAREAVSCITADPDKAKRALDWTPAIDVEQGIRDSAVWWLERLRCSQ